METKQLTFSALERRIEEIPEHPSYQVFSTRRTIWGTGIGIAAALVGLLLAKMFPTSIAALIVTGVLLAVEVIAFAIAWIAELPTLNLRPSKERQQYAETLDFDLPHYIGLIGWLKRFPRGRLELLSTYCAHRLDRMRNKLPLLTGGIEKLGALPLIAGLFLQLKDLHWPLQLHWPQILLIAFLMLCYWASMLQLSLRFRLELYDELLGQALRDQDQESRPNFATSMAQRPEESAL